ncbi:MAG: hypothetical protein KF703_05400 [Actinobacteria bacterium]|nr:hypothetical protein [Actinomycetota bacterium]
MRTRPLALLAAGLLALAPLTTACSSDTKDKASEAVDSAKDDAADAVDSAKDDVATAADATQARTTAETLRASLKANDTADEEGVRSVKALDEASADLPGDPEITGIDDADGDGLDDDGKVEVTFDEEHACLTLPEEGEEIDVTSEAC